MHANDHIEITTLELVRCFYEYINGCLAARNLEATAKVAEEQ